MEPATVHHTLNNLTTINKETVELKYCFNVQNSWELLSFHFINYILLSWILALKAPRQLPGYYGAGCTLPKSGNGITAPAISGSSAPVMHLQLMCSRGTQTGRTSDRQVFRQAGLQTGTTSDRQDFRQVGLQTGRTLDRQDLRLAGLQTGRTSYKHYFMQAGHQNGRKPLFVYIKDRTIEEEELGTQNCSRNEL